MIRIELCHLKSKALVDTGATLSCIDENILHRLGSSPLYSKSHITQVSGVGGEKHKVLGMVTLPLKFCNITIRHTFHVLRNLPRQIILGLDFLRPQSATISLHDNTLHLPKFNLSVPLVTNTTLGLVRTTKRTVIPPRSVAVIPIKVSRLISTQQTPFLLEPLPQSPTLARCILSPQGQKACQIMNPSNNPLTLRPGQVIAKTVPFTTHDMHTLDSAPSNTNRAQPRSNKHYIEIANSLGITLTDTNLSQTQKDTLLCLIGRNRDIFATSLAELGKTAVHPHKIITNDASPQRQQFYRTSPIVRKEIKRQLDELLQHGLIEPSNSEWAAPVVMVKKKSGEYRFAIDYRKLNKVTQPIHFPLPRLEDIFDTVGEARASYFSTLDMFSGYWQIPLCPTTKHKSSFTTHYGQFQWTRLPFGLRNAGTSYQQIMSDIFRDMNWKVVLCYVDDILVFSKTFDQHLQHLDQVFQTLRRSGLTLKPSKCQFAAPRVKYLGHIISKAGMEVDPDKTSAIDNFPTPTNPKEIRSFLGLCSFYRSFVQGYAQIASPLYQLLQKDIKFQWTLECEKSFQELKSKLVNAPILQMPDMAKEFILTTDASTQAIGYILGQLDENGRERAIAYSGRSLHKSEKNYSISELELLGLVEGIQHFSAYLAHNHFTVHTDHMALKWLQRIKPTTGRLGRWAILLQSYNFTIIHRKGKQNQCDALS